MNIWIIVFGLASLISSVYSADTIALGFENECGLLELLDIVPEIKSKCSDALTTSHTSTVTFITTTIFVTEYATVTSIAYTSNVTNTVLVTSTTESLTTEISVVNSTVISTLSSTETTIINARKKRRGNNIEDNTFDVTATLDVFLDLAPTRDAAATCISNGTDCIPVSKFLGRNVSNVDFTTELPPVISNLFDNNVMALDCSVHECLGATYKAIGVAVQYTMELGDFCTCLANENVETTTVYARVTTTVLSSVVTTAILSKMATTTITSTTIATSVGEMSTKITSITSLNVTRTTTSTITNLVTNPNFANGTFRWSQALATGTPSVECKDNSVDSCLVMTYTQTDADNNGNYSQYLLIPYLIPPVGIYFFSAKVLTFCTGCYVTLSNGIAINETYVSNSITYFTVFTDIIVTDNSGIPLQIYISNLVPGDIVYITEVLVYVISSLESNSVSPTTSELPSTATNLVVNGNFASGTTSWTQYGVAGTASTSCGDESVDNCLAVTFTQQDASQIQYDIDWTVMQQLSLDPGNYTMVATIMTNCVSCYVSSTWNYLIGSGTYVEDYTKYFSLSTDIIIQGYVINETVAVQVSYLEIGEMVYISDIFIYQN